MTLGIYSTGTISVTAGTSTVHGTGVAWATINEFDLLVAGGAVAFIDSVTDLVNYDDIALKGVWRGATQTNQPYQIIKFPQDWTRTQQELRDLLNRLADAGITYAVDGAAPDNSIGEDGQYAFKTNTLPWKAWLKTGGVWVAQSPPVSDVVGPAGATNNGFARFDGATGKLLKSSPTTIMSSELDAGTTAKRAAFQSAIGVREVLAANRNYFVRPDGSNSNDGLSDTAGGAFLTVQKAADAVGALDLSTFNATVNVRAGTYAENVTYKPPVGAGIVSFIGDETTPSNVVVQRFSRTATGPDLIIAGFKLNHSTSQQVFCSAGSITARNNQYEATSNYNIYITGGSMSFAGTNNKVNGGAIGLWLCETGRMDISNCTFTWIASVTYTSATAIARRAGAYIESVNFTVSLGAFSVTGSRYQVLGPAQIATSTGANHFPGSAAGSVGAGGQYS